MRSAEAFARKGGLRVTALLCGAILILGASATGAEPMPPDGLTQAWLGVCPPSLWSDIIDSKISFGVDFPAGGEVFGGELGLGGFLASGDDEGYLINLDAVWVIRGNAKIIRPRLKAGVVYGNILFGSEAERDSDVGWEAGAVIDLGGPGRVWAPLSVEVLYRDLGFVNSVCHDCSLSLTGFLLNIGFRFHTIRGFEVTTLPRRPTPQAVEAPP